jgi:zinc D-Ala-D-Ala dipeptidase
MNMSFFSRTLLMAITLLAGTRCAATDSPLVKKVHTIQLGDRPFEIVEVSHGESPWLICHVHDDERSAFEAAAEHLQTAQGRMVSIRNDAQRELGFSLGADKWSIDPNRMFLRPGILAHLQPRSPADSPPVTAVEQFARKLLDVYRLDEVRGVIACHNNSPDAYSALSYRVPGKLARDALEVHLAANQDPDNFFFVTDPLLFRDLSERRWNVVLQDNSDVTNDGSLSVYCGRMGLPYINVETEGGQTREQLLMLRGAVAALEALEEVSKSKGGLSEGITSTFMEADVELVDLATIDPDWVIDARYARNDNFMGQAFYPRNVLFLEKATAERLRRVQASLKKRGLRLKIWDAFRPLSVQKAMWHVKPDDRYVANPAKGSRHNRGAAVDVTLVDAKGNELEMPTAFDDFSERAHHNWMEASETAQRHRTLLREVMTAEGFLPLTTEWWHYDAPGWQRFPLLTRDPYAD